jgi:hypothetical protein
VEEILHLIVEGFPTVNFLFTTVTKEVIFLEIAVEVGEEVTTP